MTDWQLRPARDLDLTLAARLRSHRRETGLLGLASNALWRLTVRGYLAAAHRLEVIGAEHLPPGPPCVLVGNHTSHLDALCLGAALPGPLARHAVALAAGNVFFGTAARRHLRRRRAQRPANLARQHVARRFGLSTHATV